MTNKRATLEIIADQGFHDAPTSLIAERAQVGGVGQGLDVVPVLHDQTVLEPEDVERGVFDAVSDLVGERHHEVALTDDPVHKVN